MTVMKPQAALLWAVNFLSLGGSGDVRFGKLQTEMWSKGKKAPGFLYYH